MTLSSKISSEQSSETPDLPFAAPLADLLERPLQSSPPDTMEKPSVVTLSSSSPSKEMRMDGKRIVIEADQELEFRCGEAIILLRRNGEIVIRGNYVTSQATATQRIRGGSVHVN